MIIISQDKKQIIIFENMNIIEIFASGDKFSLRAENRDDVYVLGTYKTEERAEEILNKITLKYNEYATIQNGTGNIHSIAVLPKVYAMPKE